MLVILVLMPSIVSVCVMNNNYYNKVRCIDRAKKVMCVCVCVCDILLTRYMSYY